MKAESIEFSDFPLAEEIVLRVGGTVADAVLGL